LILNHERKPKPTLSNIQDIYAGGPKNQTRF
jgi:hypothetical protein